MLSDSDSTMERKHLIIGILTSSLSGPLFGNEKLINQLKTNYESYWEIYESKKFLLNNKIDMIWLCPTLRHSDSSKGKEHFCAINWPQNFWYSSFYGQLQIRIWENSQIWQG